MTGEHRGSAEADRAEAMGRRLDRTARRLAIPTEGRALIIEAYRMAMEPRRERIRDDHHPDYLHPARTALILMDDTGESDPVTLATALLAETRDPTLAAPRGSVEKVSPAVAAALSRIPVNGTGPDGDASLLETLLTLAPEHARVAVAERLDHARHLHLRDRREWAEYHAITCTTYAPVARRVHEVLGDRLDWWCSTFTRRFMES